MKMWILAMTMMVGVAANAQNKKERHEPLKPEQRAELQSKKMMLALDLNEKQQKDVKQLLIENGKARAEFRRQHMADRKEGKKMSADERFAMKNRMLDDRIAMKTEMKKILTPEQFKKLQLVKKDRHHEMKKKAMNFRKGHRR